MEEQVHQVTMSFLECERMAWGPFERPVAIGLDFSDLYEVPDDCRKQNVTVRYKQLQTVLVNDTEVVDYLRETYGLPAFYADMTVARQPLGGFEEHTLTIMHEAGAVSQFVTPDDGRRGQVSGPSWFRLFWFVGDRVSLMDWGKSDAISTAVVSQGHVEPPLTMGDWHTAQYAGDANLRYEGTVMGTVIQYGDHLCEQVLSSS